MYAVVVARIRPVTEVGSMLFSILSSWFSGHISASWRGLIPSFCMFSHLRTNLHGAFSDGCLQQSGAGCLPPNWQLTEEHKEKLKFSIPGGYYWAVEHQPAEKTLLQPSRGGHRPPPGEQHTCSDALPAYLESDLSVTGMTCDWWLRIGLFLSVCM